MNQFKNQGAKPVGIWLPLITPFYQGALDEESLKKLVEHYSKTEISGFILAGTTGEAMTLSDDETKRLVDVVQSVNHKHLPIYLGLTGSDTKYLAEKIHECNTWSIDGYLIATPYYSRPSQEGIYKHFEFVAKATKLPILLYNIPYRTGVNIENQTILRLAQIANIVGIKDCCASVSQTAQLLRNRPKDFSVLVGDDAGFLTSVALGANGGILASAHINANLFAEVLKLLEANRLTDARAKWSTFTDVIDLLFGEPNPGPIKYLLCQEGLIKSAELRLPMTEITKGMEQKLDAYFKQARPKSKIPA